MKKEDVDKFLAAYDRLIVSELSYRVGIAETVNTNLEDVKALLHMASVLSSAGARASGFADEAPKAWAYDVATRLVETDGVSTPHVVDAAELILCRLGNFPGRELLRSAYPVASSEERLRWPALRLEALMRQAENTVEHPRLGTLLFTDFQQYLYRSLSDSKAVSVSAPTSAGKSFVLAHDIVETLSAKTGRVLVYVVPTRALIQQVSADLLQLFRKSELPDAAVSAAPIVLADDEAKQGCVYVLTQERLVSLLANPEFKANVTAVYVDEAQEIGDVDRGLILDSAIRELIRRFPKSRVCFASPLTRNPGYLFEEFGIQRDGHFFTDTVPPVSQAIVNVDTVKGKPNNADISARTPTGVVTVGRADVPFKLRGVANTLAGVAMFVRKTDESVLVYANRAIDAMNVAENLAEKVDSFDPDSDVRDLIDFVKTHIHPQYLLATCLEKGVAFHYGRVPHIVRTRIEDLLRTRKLSFVVSTSTLLQGVNLPARHIVVLDAKKGNNTPMVPSDFWNLVGRAGRLRENFRGIVWCVDPSKWDATPFDGERLSEIKSAFQSSVETSEIREAAVAVLDATAPVGMVENRNRVEQFIGKSFAEFTVAGAKLSESPRIPEELRDEFAELDSQLQDLRSRLRVPEDVCVQNSVIAPTLLDDLWGRFASGIAPRMVPIDPQRRGAIDHFRAIFEVIEDVFIQSGKESWRYHATLACFWVRGSTLKELIDNRLQFKKTGRDTKKINSEIRGLLDDIEQTLHFTYVKYLKAYIDVLRAFYVSAGDTEKAEAISPWDLYVEFGARDRVLLTLMSLGVSRTTAIMIRPAFPRTDDVTRADCWNRLVNLRVSVLAIPGVCKDEIRRLTGSES